MMCSKCYKIGICLNWRSQNLKLLGNFKGITIFHTFKDYNLGLDFSYLVIVRHGYPIGFWGWTVQFNITTTYIKLPMYHGVL